MPLCFFLSLAMFYGARWHSLGPITLFGFAGQENVFAEVDGRLFEGARNNDVRSGYRFRFRSKGGQHQPICERYDNSRIAIVRR